MIYILALIGLIALLVGWVLFQEWLRKNGKVFRPGCGGGCSSCSTSSCSSETESETESEAPSAPQFVKIDPPKSKID